MSIKFEVENWFHTENLENYIKMMIWSEKMHHACATFIFRISASVTKAKLFAFAMKINPINFKVSEIKLNAYKHQLSVHYMTPDTPYPAVQSMTKNNLLIQIYTMDTTLLIVILGLCVWQYTNHVVSYLSNGNRHCCRSGDVCQVKWQKGIFNVIIRARDSFHSSHKHWPNSMKSRHFFSSQLKSFLSLSVLICSWNIS